VGASTTADVVATAGPRPYYCLIRDAVGSANGIDNLSKAGILELSQELTGQSDYCTSQNAAALGFAASRGQAAVSLLPEALMSSDSSLQNHLFDLIVPIYAPGAPTRTASERNAGWWLRKPISSRQNRR